MTSKGGSATPIGRELEERRGGEREQDVTDPHHLTKLLEQTMLMERQRNSNGTTAVAARAQVAVGRHELWWRRLRLGFD